MDQSLDEAIGLSENRGPISIGRPVAIEINGVAHFGLMYFDEPGRSLDAPLVGVRGGPSGVFMEFHLLPNLMAKSTRSRGDTITSWTTHFEAVGFEARHVDPASVPESLSLSPMLASDAWRFAERIGLIDANGATATGREIAALTDREERHRDSRLRDSLRNGLEAILLGRGGVSILDLLRTAANILWESGNLWVRTCPGLLPIEVGAIVH